MASNKWLSASGTARCHIHESYIQLALTSVDRQVAEASGTARCHIHESYIQLTLTSVDRQVAKATAACKWLGQVTYATGIHQPVANGIT